MISGPTAFAAPLDFRALLRPPITAADAAAVARAVGATDAGGNTGRAPAAVGNTGGVPAVGGNTGGVTDVGGHTGGVSDVGGNIGGVPDGGGNTGGAPGTALRAAAATLAAAVDVRAVASLVEATSGTFLSPARAFGAANPTPQHTTSSNARVDPFGAATSFQNSNSDYTSAGVSDPTASRAVAKGAAETEAAARAPGLNLRPEKPAARNGGVRVTTSVSGLAWYGRWNDDSYDHVSRLLPLKWLAPHSIAAPHRAKLVHVPLHLPPTHPHPSPTHSPHSTHPHNRTSTCRGFYR